MKHRNRSTYQPKRKLLTCALASVLVIASGHAIAQSSNATLRGKADAGAQVTAVNTATGTKRQVTATADGSYALVGLAPGTYKVTSGGTERTVTLQVATSVSLDLAGDAPAAPAGDATTLDTVRVSAPPLQEVKTSEVGTNVSLKQINTIPQLTRNFLEFADTVPGMQFETDSSGQSKLRGGAQKTSAINVYIDGVGQKNYVLTGGVSGQDQSRGNPFPQLAIGEYKVVTSNYKAEFDQVGSAAIIAQTKSGTNEFKGELFTRYTNTSMRQRTVSEVAAGQEKDKTKQNEYGFALGGPIIQDKMHFFFSYEAKDFVLNVNPVAAPTQWTSFEPFLPDRIRQQLGPTTEPFNEDLYFGKLSWDVGDNDRLELSAKVRDEEGLTGAGDRTTNSAAKVNFNTDKRYDLRWLHYGETFLNEARVTYEDALFNPAAYTIGNQSIYTRGLVEADTLIISDSTSSLSIQRKGQKGPAFQNDLTFNSFEWMGDHVIKVGAKFKSVELTQSENSAINPTFRYSVNDGSLGPSPYLPVGTNAIPYQVNFNAPFEGASPIVTTKAKQYGIYIQDDWDVTDRLQLNLGIRWDYEEIPSYLDFQTPTEVLAALYGPGTGSNSGGIYADQLRAGGVNIEDYIGTGNNRKADKNNWAPRLGFSYDLTGDERWVVFGGAGRSYDRNLFDYMGLEQVKSALSGYEINFVESSGCTPAAGTCVNWDPRFLNGIDELYSLVTSNVRNGEIDLLNNDLVTPYSDQYSLGIRGTIGEWNTSATVAYVHSKEGFVFTLGNRYPNGAFYGAPSWNANDIAQPWEHNPPGFGSLILGDNGIETKTTQLLLSADKPYTEESGWGFTAAYTFSRARGNRGGDEHYSFDAATIRDYPFIDLRATPRHRLVLTGIYDLPWGFTASAKVTLATPPPINAVVGWWEYGSATAVPPLIVATDAPGTFGTKQLDLSLSKHFDIAEDMGFEVRADMINVLNEENFNSYRTTWGTGGVYDPDTSFVTTGNGVNSYTPPRTLFVSARLTW
ncbi:Outer membrane receptor proteins, mostly Fe transport [Pseudoxanthomonas sp. CF385]|uniref:TonB-dependent receptor n=1 Tax=Pseudoxanthomonas sp. CF385 TaxID=1881042 RepID=UPI0008883871|nr:TonB-dependent receptor [Pseudoxanthomonas sp. CF385]SDR15131.1 Outer membrane receptor proteins, mostly Fe transport [Pseudoxanthomonas sp. CF385]